MATIDGHVLVQDTFWTSTNGRFNGRNGALFDLGVPLTAYVMQATDSVTGALYHWLRPAPDFAGAYYSGPNAPLNIAVSLSRSSRAFL